MACDPRSPLAGERSGSHVGSQSSARKTSTATRYRATSRINSPVSMLGLWFMREGCPPALMIRSMPDDAHDELEATCPGGKKERPGLPVESADGPVVEQRFPDAGPARESQPQFERPRA